jgi:hypothetical protein
MKAYISLYSVEVDILVFSIFLEISKGYSHES